MKEILNLSLSELELGQPTSAYLTAEIEGRQ